MSIFLLVWEYYVVGKDGRLFVGRIRMSSFRIYVYDKGGIEFVS